MACLINCQTLKMIYHVESFPYPDKQETSEEGQWIQKLKRCVSTNNNKDVDNSPKNHTQNIVHQESYLKYFLLMLFCFSHDSHTYDYITQMQF